MDMLLFPAIIFYVLLPSIVLFTITWGFLSELRIFKQEWIKFVLSFSVMFSTYWPIPILPYVVRWGMALMGYWGLIAFEFLFLTGIYYFISRKRAQWGTTAGVYKAYKEETQSLRREYAEIGDAIADLVHKMATETDPGKRASLERSLQELHDRRNDIGERLKEMAEHMKSV